MSDGATQDPQGRSFIVGAHRVTGLAKGASMTVEYDADTFQMLMGLDGEGVYIKQDDDSATIVLTLLPSSVSNDVLTALFLAAKRTPGGLSFPLLLKDDASGGRTVGGAATAVITKLPAVGYSESGETRVWTLKTTKWTSYVGGASITPANPDQPQTLAQAQALADAA